MNESLEEVKAADLALRLANLHVSGASVEQMQIMHAEIMKVARERAARAARSLGALEGGR